MSVFKNMKAAYKFASQKRMDKPSRMRYIIYRQVCLAVFKSQKGHRFTIMVKR